MNTPITVGHVGWSPDYKSTPMPPETGEIIARRSAEACSEWRDPKTDPPTKTGKILIWIDEIGPSIVNVEERWMCYWNGYDETEATAPYEWDWWMEIFPPNASVMAQPGKSTGPMDLWGIAPESEHYQPNATSEGPPPSRLESNQEAPGGSLH